MRKLFLLPLAALSAFLLTATPALACGTDKNCGGVCTTESIKLPAKAVKGEVVKSVYAVSGLKCQNCVNGVTKKLRDVDGVAQVEVSLTAHTATVTHGKGQADLAALNAALKGHFKLAASGSAPAGVPAAAPAAAPAADVAPAACPVEQKAEQAH